MYSGFLFFVFHAKSFATNNRSELSGVSYYAFSVVIRTSTNFQKLFPSFEKNRFENSRFVSNFERVKRVSRLTIDYYPCETQGFCNQELDFFSRK